MKVCFDTNIVLDLVLDRKPFSPAAAFLCGAVERGVIGGLLCATTLTTVHYLTAKAASRTEATQAIAMLLKLFDIAPVNRPVLAAALERGFLDFEDAVLHEAALRSGAEALVTRNAGDFTRATLPIYSPEAMVRLVASLDWLPNQP